MSHSNFLSPKQSQTNLYYNTANNIEKYLKAKSTYQQILAINTNDSYSKKRISACDAKIRQLKHIASDNALWNKIKEGNTTKEQYEQYISLHPEAFLSFLSFVLPKQSFLFSPFPVINVYTFIFRTGNKEEKTQ